MSHGCGRDEFDTVCLFSYYVTKNVIRHILASSTSALYTAVRKKIRYNRILTSPQKKPSVKTNSLPLQYDQCLVIRELPCTKQLAGFLAERSSHAFYLPSLASGILQSHAPLSQWRDRTGITPVSLLTLASAIRIRFDQTAYDAQAPFVYLWNCG